MTGESGLYSALLLSMALGAVIVVGGTFVQNGIGTIAALGGVFILLGVGGLAHLASEAEDETVSTHATETTTEDSEPMHGGKTS